MDPLRSAMICLQHPVESERISLYEALELFTVNAAKIGFLEDRKGMLKVGMDADVAILDANPFATPVPDIADIRVVKDYIERRDSIREMMKNREQAGSRFFEAAACRGSHHTLRSGGFAP